MTTASRTSDYGPMAVFFDATDPASGVIQPVGDDFDTLHYAWDFGDPGAGTWGTDGKSRNEDTGFVAGHLYETPGTYTVRLHVTAVDGTTYDYEQTITVLDLIGWTTYYVSNDGDDDNDGLSPDTPLATFSAAMSHIAPSTRILFNRGDTWIVDDDDHEATRFGDGPGIVGAYGNGNKPVIQVDPNAGGVTLFQFQFGNDNFGWSLMDLRLVGNGPFSGSQPISWVAPLSRALFLRLEIADWTNGITNSFYLFTCEQLDQISIVDSEISNTADWPIYFGGTRSIIMGNVLDKQIVSQSHTLRIWCPDRLILAHNDIRSGFHSSLKLHNDQGGIKRDIIISDNIFQGSNWTVALAPQNGSEDERLANILFERNQLIAAENRTSVALLIAAEDVTIRNNIFIADHAGSDYRSVYFGSGYLSPTQNIRFYNNTFYRGTASDIFYAVWLQDPNASNITFRNNLIYTPLTNSTTGIYDGEPGQYTESNNIWPESGINPLFVDPNNGDFSLQSDSPAIDAGYDTGVLYDYAGNTRFDAPVPDTGTGTVPYYDIGALEFVPTEPTAQLQGIAGNQNIHLSWEVHGDFPPEATWQITYDGPAGTPPSPITDIPNNIRSYDLTGLTNFVTYDVTLQAMVSGSPILTATVSVIPTNISIYLPIVIR